MYFQKERRILRAATWRRCDVGTRASWARLEHWGHRTDASPPACASCVFSGLQMQPSQCGETAFTQHPTHVRLIYMIIFGVGLILKTRKQKLSMRPIFFPSASINITSEAVIESLINVFCFFGLAIFFTCKIVCYLSIGCNTTIMVIFWMTNISYFCRF